MDGIIHITTEAITIDIVIKGITTSISIAGTTIGTGVGLSASVGAQDTIAIGKRIDAPQRARHSVKSAAGYARNVPGIFDSKRSVCRNWA
jgi:hypothetical protein